MEFTIDLQEGPTLRIYLTSEKEQIKKDIILLLYLYNYLSKLYKLEIETMIIIWLLS